MTSSHKPKPPYGRLSSACAGASSAAGVVLCTGVPQKRTLPNGRSFTFQQALLYDDSGHTIAVRLSGDAVQANAHALVPTKKVAISYAVCQAADLKYCCASRGVEFYSCSDGRIVFEIEHDDAPYLFEPGLYKYLVTVPFMDLKPDKQAIVLGHCVNVPSSNERGNVYLRLRQGTTELEVTIWAGPTAQRVLKEVTEAMKKNPGKQQNLLLTHMLPKVKGTQSLVLWSSDNTTAVLNAGLHSEGNLINPTIPLDIGPSLTVNICDMHPRVHLAHLHAADNPVGTVGVVANLSSLSLSKSSIKLACPNGNNHTVQMLEGAVNEDTHIWCRTCHKNVRPNTRLVDLVVLTSSDDQDTFTLTMTSQAYQELLSMNCLDIAKIIHQGDSAVRNLLAPVVSKAYYFLIVKTPNGKHLITGVCPPPAASPNSSQSELVGPTIELE